MAKFVKYKATQRFYIGTPIKLYIDGGEEIEFDGRNVRFRDQVYVAPNLNGMLKADPPWVVPVDSIKTTKLTAKTKKKAVEASYQDIELNPDQNAERKIPIKYSISYFTAYHWLFNIHYIFPRLRVFNSRYRIIS